MSAGEATPGRSPLEKPLAELTEEDIAQLTREDCRRFLKDKGMRRPSWNKSQAIQQVISLKALLEGRPGAGDTPVGFSLILKPPPPASPHVVSSSQQKEGSGGSQPSPSPSPSPSLSPSPYRRRRDPLLPVFSAVGPPPVAIDPLSPEHCCFSPRAAVGAPTGQLTIFYDGRINVYDGVTPDKARAIMHLAASPDGLDCWPVLAAPIRSPFPRLPATTVPGPGPPAAQPLPPTASIFPPPPAGAGRSPPRSSRKVAEGRSAASARATEPAVGPPSRKASIQRYLEKRKDRLKGRRVLGGSSSSTMDIVYLSQMIQGQPSNVESNRSDTSSPAQPGQPGTRARHISAKYQAEKVSLSFDLNNEAGGGDI